MGGCTGAGLVVCRPAGRPVYQLRDNYSGYQLRQQLISAAVCGGCVCLTQPCRVKIVPMDFVRGHEVTTCVCGECVRCVRVWVGRGGTALKLTLL